MTESSSNRTAVPRPFAAGFLLLALGLLGTGCGDLETAPQIEVATSETMPTLRLQGVLLDLPSLADRWGDGLPMESIVDRWKASWELPAEAGERERRELYAAVAHPLSPHLPDEWLNDELTRARGTLSVVVGLVYPNPHSHWTGALSVAHVALEAAEAAVHRGDEESALVFLLQAGDALRALTPGMMARQLISAAEALDRRILVDTPYDGQMIRRGERLLEGARLALTAGNEALALRRAYYALRLLTPPVDG